MGIDQNVLDFFVNNRTEWLTFIMLVITYSGSYMIVAGLTFLSVISFFIHKHYSRILPLVISVAGSAMTTALIKYFFNRSRPPFTDMIYPENGMSFPSGHATAAMALYGFLIYVIWRHDKHHLKNPLIVFLSVLIILVGVSRLYLGVHYFSDVLGGYAVGLVWILIGAKVENKIERLINWRPKL